MKPQKEKILSILKEIIPLLSMKYGVTRIGLFGSVARNEASEESDVDIVYEMSRPNLFVVVHLRNELEQILHFPVDLVRYREKMNPWLKKRIEKEGVYV
ncbi:MAG: nucleotidyltransferase family protein [Planctomycetota bacterium]|jgi:predicted nucleotidyltransferase